jgi:hypothetical protein
MRVKPIILFASIILLVGCGLNPKLTEVTLAQNPPWLDDFLYQPTCPPPCWENIIPGETALAGAREILYQKTGINTVTINDDFAIAYLNWSFNDSLDIGSIAVETKIDRVRYIGFEFDKTPYLTLKEAEDVYGSPNHVLIELNSHNTIYCSLTFYFDRHRMEIRTGIMYPCPNKKNIPIGEDVIIEYITLHAGTEENWLTTVHPLVDITPWLEEWQGYGDYVYDLP